MAQIRGKRITTDGLKFLFDLNNPVCYNDDLGYTNGVYDYFSPRKSVDIQSSLASTYTPYTLGVTPAFYNVTLSRYVNVFNPTKVNFINNQFTFVFLAYIPFADTANQRVIIGHIGRYSYSSVSTASMFVVGTYSSSFSGAKSIQFKVTGNTNFAIAPSSTPASYFDKWALYTITANFATSSPRVDLYDGVTLVGTKILSSTYQNVISVDSSSIRPLRPYNGMPDKTSAFGKYSFYAVYDKLLSAAERQNNYSFVQEKFGI